MSYNPIEAITNNAVAKATAQQQEKISSLLIEIEILTKRLELVAQNTATNILRMEAKQEATEFGYPMPQALAYQISNLIFGLDASLNSQEERNEYASHLKEQFGQFICHFPELEEQE